MGHLSERRVIFLVGAVQFVNVLDFTMVMPLGPDFAAALHIAPSELGKVIAGYGPAAALAGLLGSFFLDRFDRRKALAVTMLGLVAGTLAGGLAHNLTQLTLARVIAGAFGGPATSLAYAVIADVIPPARRGKAMGAVMGAFSVAQVVGVTAAVIASRHFGWQTPFFGTAAIGLVVTIGAILLLPPLTAHRDAARAAQAPAPALGQLLSRPTVWLSYAMTAVLMASGFLVIPNFPSWVLNNLGYPRDRLPLLVAVGGAASFVTLRLVGRLVDRWGSSRIATLAVAASLGIMYVYFVRPPHPAPVLLLHVSFMIALGARNVAYNALTSQVPQPFERARFLSIQSTVYHAVAGLAAWLSSSLLSARPDGALVGMTRVVVISMALGALFPLLLRLVEGRVRREGAAAPSPPAIPPTTA
jgi:predicted MFS family arabinose efflux permease